MMTRVEFAKYVNEDGSRNFFMQDNTIYEEKVKGYYQSLNNLLEGYSKSNHFVVSSETESYKLTDHQRVLKHNSMPLKTVYSEIMPLIRDIYDPELTSEFLKNIQMMFLRKEFKKVTDDFDRLGHEAIKELKFDPRKIKAEIVKRDLESQQSNFGFMQYIENNYKVGQTSSAHALVNVLQQGVSAHNLRHLKPSIKLLSKYCELSDRVWIGTNDNGKNIMGYRVLKITIN
ncbi:hypothetical protein KXQ82_10345 [Mucilaginibacter sp. HMF5004]|uniref:hypothetical protein n=1 Tax=Mucilaginibacter rivuli TaxID=2857527 RepID=UPI001C5D300F|nr:hypothetical protein [Mucilaginibacter rivuli]MBW4890118.1 hypothetical protein [Mucilaginibacter rivuli]